MKVDTLIELVTSVDVGSLVPPLGLLNELVNAIFAVIGSGIDVWPAGSAATAGSLQAVLGSVGGL